MLVINNLKYESRETIIFQRLSVIFMDAVYCYGVHRCCKVISKGWRTDVVLPILLITNCGLIMLDHIHFQYNGFMYGILLLSIADMCNDRFLKSAFWFVVLLNLKHIYVYASPAYFIYLLKTYCLCNRPISDVVLTQKCWSNTIKLGSVVIGVFVISFLPFYDHLPQIISRLFPLKRGLCHAYWAPNVWALYNIVDKAVFFAASKLGYHKGEAKAAMTGGLVQEYSHLVLPNITPRITIILSLIFVLPLMVKLWKLKCPTDFIRCIALCSLTAFLFGYHVHEKAILMAIIPITILSVRDPLDAKIFLILSTVGYYSLFPLLYPKNLFLVKTLLLIIHSLYSFHSLSKMYTMKICKYSLPLLNIFESFYLFSFCLIHTYEHFIHNLLDFQNKLPFLPLMITSVYCSVGVIYCWILYFIFSSKDLSQL
ncbi:hypothetical protein HHI36_016977 [Cryptolaemus montrouzieri]